MGRGYFDPYRYLLETYDRKSIGRAVLLAATLFGSSGPASAITAEVAKKCREQAIQAHPPQRAGTIPYAEAERAYFNECVNNAGSLEGEPPPSRDVGALERGGTVLRSQRLTRAPCRHHRRSRDRLTLWGRNPAYPLLSAAGYGDRILVVAKPQPGLIPYQVWNFHYRHNHCQLANRKLARTHYAGP
jgi:hypothetical protein